MYITTFYSFKGGVGRSMALANSAVELSQAGNKVLVVDFDIEAPGLDTFGILKPEGNPPGLVDYVLKYLETGKAPDATEFIHKSSGEGLENGSLLIMPSGTNKSYDSLVNQIDWIKLYKDKDGYLLFEELKEQWRQNYKPDYVLIDSRTGHSDTSGICTRQLPDAVVILFFPNDQNLRGLTKIVKSINNEKKIKLHYVMSNVPYLDDEDRILFEKRENFRRKLFMKRPPLIVHRYDSLSLLNQELFLLTRPKSRLASEYKKIIDEITKYNTNDYQGSIRYIKDNISSYKWRISENYTEHDKRIQQIESKHQENGKLLFHLGELYDFRGESAKALDLYTQAISKGFNQPRVYIELSSLLEKYDKKQEARDVLLSIFDLETVDLVWVRRALLYLIRIGNFNLEEVADKPALSSLNVDDKYWLAQGFNSFHEQSQIAVYLYNQILKNGIPPEGETECSIKFSLGLSLMSLGKCDEAKLNFAFVTANSFEKYETMASTFNFAMANWGASEKEKNKNFQKVLDRLKDDKSRSREPNFYQCIALAYWGIGDKKNSMEYLKKAREKFSRSGKSSEFSCWRYFLVHKSKFMEDLDEIEKLFKGNKSMKPKFLLD